MFQNLSVSSNISRFSNIRYIGISIPTCLIFIHFKTTDYEDFCGQCIPYHAVEAEYLGEVSGRQCLTVQAGGRRRTQHLSGVRHQHQRSTVPGMLLPVDVFDSFKLHSI